MADQQFCLRWNNHQSTLISVFDSLQERGCMVDCTLAAEGQSLQAHKVVMSACSPYLEELLSKHYDKHPILLLKDVKFEELKAMIDYMYRGEVNVAQDKLATFLRAAESLQIKGLSDGGTDPPDTGGVTSATKRTNKGTPVASVRANPLLTVKETTVNEDVSRDGSVSPSQRKRRRRKSETSEVNGGSSSNVPESRPTPQAAAAVSSPSVTPTNQELLPTVPLSGLADPLLSLIENSETVIETGSVAVSNTVVPPPRENNVIREKDSDVLLEPKTEFLDEDVQDLTLEDDLYRAGPSQGRASGNFLADTSDEVYMSAQDSGSNRDAQGITMVSFF